MKKLIMFLAVVVLSLAAYESLTFRSRETQRIEQLRSDLQARSERELAITRAQLEKESERLKEWADKTTAEARRDLEIRRRALEENDRKWLDENFPSE